MMPLSREAQDALKGLEVKEPSAADEARVRAGVQRAVGVALPAAAIATAGTAQAAVGASVLGVGAKLLVFVAAVGVGSLTAVTVKASINGREAARAEAPPAVAGGPTAPESELSGAGAAALPSQPEPGSAVVAAALPSQPEPGSAVVAAAPASHPAPGGAVVAAAAPPPRASAAPVNPRGSGRGSFGPPPPPAPNPSALAGEPPPLPAPEPAVAGEGTKAPPPAPPSVEQYEALVETDFATCDAATEKRSAQSARKLLNLDRPQEAVWLLGVYQRRCPSGRWSDEAWEVRIAGLCRLGRTPEVIGLLQWFSTEYPARRAGLVESLRSACPEPVLRRATAE